MPPEQAFFFVLGFWCTPVPITMLPKGKAVGRLCSDKLQKNQGS